MTREEKHLPISASMLFEIFPFSIVFGWVWLSLKRIGNYVNIVLIIWDTLMHCPSYLYQIWDYQSELSYKKLFLKLRCLIHCPLLCYYVCKCMLPF
jgi:hypothetical protein